MAFKGFAALAALVVVAAGMSSQAFAARPGQVKDIPSPEQVCANKWGVGTPRYDACVGNRTDNLADRQEKAKNKALEKCDNLSPRNAKECKCSIDPALPICSASLS